MATNTSNKSICKYGGKCYRKNADHLANFWHPPIEVDEEESATKRKDEENPTPGNEEKRRKVDASEEDKSEAGAEDEEKQEEEDDDDESDDEDNWLQPPTPEGLDLKEELKFKFKAEMPKDFFDFWDFCKSLNHAQPTDALINAIGLQLVGPYDVVAGKFKSYKGKGKRPYYFLHYRYYYDPPEFQTVLKGDDTTQHHLGYYRDDPAELPAFVGSSHAAKDCTIKQQGNNIFAAVKLHIDSVLRSVKDEKRIAAVKKLEKNLTEWAQKTGHTLKPDTKELRDRNKKVVTKTFHGAGIVVPVEDEVGYRELPETDGNLKKMFRKISEAKNDEERIGFFEPLQEIITFIQFANDECDYGEGYELGIDLFCFGASVFNKVILNTLPLAYELLDRDEFAQIIRLHLMDRRKGNVSLLED